MAEHTPTPWIATFSRTFTKGRRKFTLEQDPHHAHRWIGDLWLTEGLPDAVQDANARFIVQACNAHDELLAALKELVPLVGEDNLPEDVNDILDRALAAIAKATSPQAQ